MTIAIQQDWLASETDDLPQYGFARGGLFIYPAWTAALAQARRASARQRLVAVVAPAGLGKTAFLQCLARTLQDAGEAVLLVPGGDLGPLSRGALLIDDADRLTPRAVRSIAERGGTCVLAGLPGLPGRLGLAAAECTVIDLPPLAVAEVGDYFAVALPKSGSAKPFSPGAVAALAQHGAGGPRVVQALAELGEFLARLEDAPHVSPAHVGEAARVQGGTALPEPEEMDAPPAPATEVAEADAAAQLRPGLPAGLGGFAVTAALLLLAAPSHDARPLPPGRTMLPPLTRAMPVLPILLPSSSTAVLAARSAPSLHSPGDRLPPGPAGPAPDLLAGPMPALLPLAAAPGADAPSPVQAARSPGARLRVDLAYAAGDATGPIRGAKIRQRLQSLGVPVTESNARASRTDGPEIGYFFAEDAAAAQRVAGEIGYADRAELVTPRADARPGLVRVILPSPGPATRPRRAS